MDDVDGSSLQTQNETDFGAEIDVNTVSKLQNWEDIIVGAYLLTVFILALTLNALVIYTCLHNWKSLMMSDYYILNLACSDVLLPICAFPFPISSSFKHRWLYGNIGCIAYGFLGFFFGLVSITTLTVMGLTRYISVCRPHINISSTKFTQNSIVFAYAYAVVWSAIPLTGWGSYSLESYGTSCTLQWDGNRVFITLMSLFCISTPSIVMFCTYTLILLKSRRSHRNVRGRKTSNMSRNESYLIKITFAMCWGFLISWMPYAVVSMWTAYGDISLLPMRTTVAAVLLAKTSTVVNPVIYFLMSNKFRPLLKRSLGGLKMRLIGPRHRYNSDRVTFRLVRVESNNRRQSSSNESNTASDPASSRKSSYNGAETEL